MIEQKWTGKRPGRHRLTAAEAARGRARAARSRAARQDRLAHVAARRRTLLREEREAYAAYQDARDDRRCKPEAVVAARVAWVNAVRALQDVAPVVSRRSK